MKDIMKIALGIFIGTMLVEITNFSIGILLDSAGEEESNNKKIGFGNKEKNIEN